jgi:hypothetical protein
MKYPFNLILSVFRKWAKYSRKQRKIKHFGWFLKGKKAEMTFQISDGFLNSERKGHHEKQEKKELLSS